MRLVAVAVPNEVKAARSGARSSFRHTALSGKTRPRFRRAPTPDVERM
ncbi:hypothetical protein [Pontibacter ummariensis]|nr:hypothetical protein [Pontibacter ummariensis]